MFKALHARSGEEILSIGPGWVGRTALLRSLDRQDLLVCQGCFQPVRLKAGARKRTHFAHKHLQGCSLGSESVRLLAARALLYDTLAARFPGQVDLEWRAEEAGLPRPVDCVVRTPTAEFAFWIVDVTLKLEARRQIQAGFEALKLPVGWLILTNLLRLDPNQPAWLLLSPTERDFARRTPYDEIGGGQQPIAEEQRGSLHYLDPEHASLITYRALARIHAPNVFVGRREEAGLDALSLSPRGEWVYPGEESELAASSARRERQLERVRRWLEPAPHPAPARPAPRPPQPAQGPDEVICVYCGEMTSDWWTAWGEAGLRLGKCRACLDRGLG